MNKCQADGRGTEVFGLIKICDDAFWSLGDFVSWCFETSFEGVCLSAGDVIYSKNIGAYSSASAVPNFNGFEPARIILV